MIKHLLTSPPPNIPSPYLMSLKDTLVSPAIDAYIYRHFGHEVPWPSVTATQAYCQWMGHTPTAIRTAISRAKTQEQIKIKINPRRVALGTLLTHQVQYYLQDSLSDHQFSLIITHFSEESDNERYRVKDLLVRLGYVKFTPNTYLRYGSSPESVHQWLEKQSMTDSVYHFHPLEDIPSTLKKELPSLYDLDTWRHTLTDYSDFLNTFLVCTDLETREGYLSYLYVRSAFHKRIMTRAPFLPQRYFAEVTLLTDAYKRLGQLAHTHREKHLEHYQTFFGSEHK